MDLDAFVAEHQGEWDRLRRLAGKRKRRMSAEEVDELVALYHRTATHLSIVRSRSPDPAVVAWLSRLVLQARAALTPSSGFTGAGLARFLLVSFPGEVVRASGWWGGVLLISVLLIGIRMAVVADDPTGYMSTGQIDDLVNHSFEAYYSSFQPQNFAMLVWTNNTFIAALCLATGVLILPVLLILYSNIENIGMVGGVMVGSGRGDIFFGLVLIHGLLELTAVFIAAGVGLRIGWAWIAPGSHRTRAQALAERARSAMVVALGLAIVLLISGLIEAFVTPLPVPIPIKLAFGALVWLGFLGYLGSFGTVAVLSRQSADVDPLDRPAEAPTLPAG
ncbi:MAG TPA: stage II sporulation protein M [Natronosporangium sp.]